MLAPALCVAACSEPPDDSVNNYSDPALVRIADLKDRQVADSLYIYFDHENPQYRREAVEAFGSLQDSGNVDRIGKLLVMDQDHSVREAAAFALGQLQHPSCERLLLAALMKEKKAGTTFEILQAYGKATRLWKLEPSIFLNDSMRTAGLAWSIYRAGLRGKTDSLANRVAKTLLSDKFSHLTRLGAAHFFSRGATAFDDATASLVAAATKDPSAEVRMAAALALGKITSDSSFSTLRTIIEDEPDARVVVNAIRAIKSFPFDSAQSVLFDCVHHKNESVGIAASEVIRDVVTAKHWITVSSQANHVGQWRILANLYEGALRAGQHPDVASEIQSAYEKAVNPYERTALLAALKGYPPAYKFVEEELLNADTPLIRSTAASTLVAMNHSAHFPQQYKSTFAKMYESLIRSEQDPAVIGTIASALADSTLGYRAEFSDAAFLAVAKDKLKLPEHIEALKPVEAAIAHLERRKPRMPNNPYNHPIDWELVKQISKDQLATIKTSRGSMVIRLLVNEAPGSVANFVALARQDYFDNKPVHRVVPNFVIQAGCNRGDGWGSEDYSLRSEFSTRMFRTGSLGMASAGKDTEGTQWFITHSPTPHLDGRYTIFGEVTEGMAVIHLLQVGDKITDVEVDNFKAQ